MQGRMCRRVTLEAILSDQQVWSELSFLDVQSFLEKLKEVLWFFADKVNFVFSSGTIHKYFLVLPKVVKIECKIHWVCKAMHKRA